MTRMIEEGGQRTYYSEDLTTCWFVLAEMRGQRMSLSETALQHEEVRAFAEEAARATLAAWLSGAQVELYGDPSPGVWVKREIIWHPGDLDQDGQPAPEHEPYIIWDFTVEQAYWPHPPKEAL